MKRGAIVIDEWKLPIFKRRLSLAGFSFETAKGPSNGCVSLFVTVPVSDVKRLAHCVFECNAEAAEQKQARRSEKAGEN